MNEYMGKRGNNTYLYSKDFGECVVFDSIGKFISNTGFIGDCKSVIDVDIVSILSNGDKSVIYFDGMQRVVDLRYVTLIQRVMKNYPTIGGMIYRVNHSKNGKIEVNQVLLVYNKGALKREALDGLLFEYSSLWESL